MIKGRLSIDEGFDNTEIETTTGGMDPGVSGQKVYLYDQSDQLVATTTTDEFGGYQFEVVPGTYYIQFEQPDGFGFASSNVGDNRFDSDADSGGQTAPVTVAEGEVVADIDASLQAHECPPEENSTDAVDDKATTSVATPVAVDVLANDNDLEGDQQFIESFTDGGNGTVAEGPNGELIYTPKPGFSGIDTFTYTILDERGETDTATVTITVEDDGGPTIPGTPEDDFICGTEGDDHINGGEGIDVFGGSYGDDILDGGDEGYNQVNYGGMPSDYVFSANPDGSISVEKPNGAGTDTLKDIDGVWFAGEDKWYAIEDMFTPDNANGDNSGSSIAGTDDDDYLSGTEGDDAISGLEGVDVIVGSGGNDTIDGGAGDYNQIDYEGSSSDYRFTQGQDGSIIVEKHGGNGVDALINIDGVWFAGDDQWFAMEDLIEANDNSEPQPDGKITGTSGDDYLVGTSGDDVIHAGDGMDVIKGTQGNDVIHGGDSGYNQVDYEGQASDYLFVANDDGSYKVTAPNGDVDLLVDISGVWFAGEDAWYEIEDLA